MLEAKIPISFLLARSLSIIARINVLRLLAALKDIWSDKEQGSLRKKLFVSRSPTDRLRTRSRFAQRKLTSCQLFPRQWMSDQTPQQVHHISSSAGMPNALLRSNVVASNFRPNSRARRQELLSSWRDARRATSHRPPPSSCESPCWARADTCAARRHRSTRSRPR